MHGSGAKVGAGEREFDVVVYSDGDGEHDDEHDGDDDGEHDGDGDGEHDGDHDGDDDGSSWTHLSTPHSVLSTSLSITSSAWSHVLSPEALALAAVTDSKQPVLGGGVDDAGPSVAVAFCAHVVETEGADDDMHSIAGSVAMSELSELTDACAYVGMGSTGSKSNSNSEGEDEDEDEDGHQDGYEDELETVEQSMSLDDLQRLFGSTTVDRYYGHGDYQFNPGRRDPPQSYSVAPSSPIVGPSPRSRRRVNGIGQDPAPKIQSETGSAETDSVETDSDSLSVSTRHGYPRISPLAPPSRVVTEVVPSAEEGPSYKQALVAGGGGLQGPRACMLRPNYKRAVPRHERQRAPRTRDHVSNQSAITSTSTNANTSQVLGQSAADGLGIVQQGEERAMGRLMVRAGRRGRVGSRGPFAKPPRRSGARGSGAARDGSNAGYGHGHGHLAGGPLQSITEWDGGELEGDDTESEGEAELMGNAGELYGDEP